MAISKVLLVDDEEDIRTICSMTLSTLEQWNVVIATCGPEALTMAADEQPDVILLDVMMPGMDGTATFIELKKNPITSSIPVIFMTAKVQKQEVRRYMELGARGVISKPFDPMTLPDRVRALANES